jgi:hypothetical protein
MNQDKTTEQAAEENYGTPVLQINENTQMQVRSDGGGLVIVQNLTDLEVNKQIIVISDNEAKRLSICIQQAYDYSLLAHTGELYAEISELTRKTATLTATIEAQREEIERLTAKSNLQDEISLAISKSPTDFIYMLDKAIKTGHVGGASINDVRMYFIKCLLDSHSTVLTEPVYFPPL